MSRFEFEKCPHSKLVFPELGPQLVGFGPGQQKKALRGRSLKVIAALS